MRFKDFICTRRRTNNPKGDFVADAQGDPSLPDDFRSMEDFVVWLRAKDACEEAIVVGCQLWREFETKFRPNPLQTGKVLNFKHAQRKEIPKSTRFNVLRRDNFTCRYCGRSSPDVVLHIDHVKPHSLGGDDSEGNLVAACVDCNLSKGAKIGIAPPELRATGNFVGLFGHSLDDAGHINRQFSVHRQVGAAKYAIQLYAFSDGQPSRLEIVNEEFLSLPNVRLYPDEKSWIWASCEDSADLNRERGLDPWLCNVNNLFERYFSSAGKRIL